MKRTRQLRGKGLIHRGSARNLRSPASMRPFGFPVALSFRSSENSSGIEGSGNAQGGKAACFTLLRPEGVHQAFDSSPAPETTWKGQAENGKGGSHEHDYHTERAEQTHDSGTRRAAPVAHVAAGRGRARFAGTPQYLGIACKRRSRTCWQGKTRAATHLQALVAANSPRPAGYFFAPSRTFIDMHPVPVCTSIDVQIAAHRAASNANCLLRAHRYHSRRQLSAATALKIVVFPKRQTISIVQLNITLQVL